MRKNQSPGFTMRIYFTLLVMAEFSLILIGVWAATALFERFFHMTFALRESTWLILIGVLLSGAITAFLGKWIFNPILKLNQAMKEVSHGNFDIALSEEHRFEEIREIHASFNRMTCELKAMEILQTDFVSNVSHEFKTPISAIEGYATLLQNDENNISREHSLYIEKILLNTHRLSSLVGNILLLSKVDNQAIPSKANIFRLDEQVRQCVVLLEPEWSKKEIEFDVELDTVVYTGNESLLHHVWYNLIENAIKFNPLGGTVCLRLKREDKCCIFTIEDSGPGISEEIQSHIFDRFYQSDNSHKEEGNGLGLALVKQILKLSGGEITVENIAGGGSRFTVLLRES